MLLTPKRNGHITTYLVTSPRLRQEGARKNLLNRVLIPLNQDFLLARELLLSEQIIVVCHMKSLFRIRGCHEEQKVKCCLKLRRQTQNT
jgi:hypothetical protein